MIAERNAEFEAIMAQGEVRGGPRVEFTQWGYSLHSGNLHDSARHLASIAGRFFGAILLMAAAGLWIMPDAAMGADIFAMKLGAMVMFTVLGGWLVWAGRHETKLEYEVDLTRAELRVGARDLRGIFHLKAVVPFGEVSSVYLLRSKDHRQPARLFLRLGRGDDALELISGPHSPMELLRDRLTQDMTRPAIRPTRPVVRGERPSPRMTVVA